MVDVGDRVAILGANGIGKTTLLNTLLRHPEMNQAAVIVNEFGEIGIDYDLVERSDENVVQLANGCLCCSVKGDLIDTFRDLYIQRNAGTIPYFDRVVIETISENVLSHLDFLLSS